MKYDRLIPKCLAAASTPSITSEEIEKDLACL